MAIREYVGARYVPRFTGLYDATQIYDALDVVDNGAGTSYIARKTVPAGTPLTDNEFWFVYGASSGAIVSLQNRMDAAENDLTGIHGDITTINNKIDDINRKKVLLLSDSYGSDNVSGGQSWETFVSNNLAGHTVLKQFIGGGGFGWTGNEPEYFPNFFNTLTADSDVDMILLLAGANDGNLLYLNRTTRTDIINGFIAGMSILRTKYPNADIHVGFVGRYKNRNHYIAYKNARDAYMSACMNTGISFANNFEYILHAKSLIGDQDIHPTFAGSSKIGYYAIKYIKNRHIDVIEDYQAADTLSEIGSDFTLDIHINNGVTIVKPNFGGSNNVNIPVNKAVSGTGNVTFEFNYETDIFDSADVIQGCGMGYLLYNDGAAQAWSPAQLLTYFLNGKFTIFTWKKPAEHNGTYTQVTIMPPALTFDTMLC